MNRWANQRVSAFLVMMMALTIIAPPAWAQGASTQVLGQHRAIISQVQGTVEVRAVGRSTWATAARNMEVKTGDRIRTGPSSKCKLRISDVGEMELTSSSEATVGNLQQIQTTARAFFMFQRTITRDDVGLDLRNGDVRSSFRRHEGRVGNYNVHTPVAVAGVRGTKFELDLEGGRPWYERLEANDDGKGQGFEQELTTIVLEGEVEMIGPNWSRSVRAGEQLQSRTGQVPGQPGGADPGRLEELSGAFQPAGDVQPPVFSGATSMTRPSAGDLLVSWNAASDNVTSATAILYDIFVATAKGAQDYSEPTVTSEPGATSVTLTGTDDASEYFVVVRARDAAGNRDLNTKEVTTSAVADVTAPTFDGALSAKKLTISSVIVKWEAASDDRSAAEKIVYDVYVATSPGGQNFAAPTATSAPGATTLTLTNQPSGLDYYVVVRARDEEGNRDDNMKEVFAFAFGEACARAAAELFTAYEQENEGQFMAAIDPSFNGVNEMGIKLNASTLSSSVKYDFSALKFASYTANINTASEVGENRYQLDLTWSGRLRFEAVDTEQVISGMPFKMIWVGDRLPLQLAQWEGESPFGMSDPIYGVTLVRTAGDSMIAISGSTTQEINSGATGDLSNFIVPVAAPTIASITGLPTTYDLQGDNRDFAPARGIVTGSGFQSGATVMVKPQYDALWENWGAMNDADFQTSVYFVSSTELWIDVARMILQYTPDHPLTENIDFYVQNPDGQNSAITTISTTMVPGPLRMTGSLLTDRQVLTAADANPYQFTLEGYNMVAPLTVGISSNGAAADANVTVSGVNIYGGDVPNPLSLSFAATVSGAGLPSGTAYVIVRDARGQTDVVPFAVNTATNVTWATSQTLNADYIVPAGNTLTINSGVTVSTTANARIIVDGTLNASGATFNGVGVEFRTGSTGTLSNVTIQNVLTSPATGLTVDGGNVSMTGGRVTGCGTGISLSAGSLSLSNLTVDYNTGGVGISVTGGSLPTFSNVISRNNRIGLSVNGGTLNPTVSGGAFSSNTDHGIIVAGGASLTVTTGTQFNGNGQQGLLVSDAKTVNVSNATFSSNSSSGIQMDNLASGATLTLASVNISGSPNGVFAQAGALLLTGGNSIAGGSTAGIELDGSVSLTVSGTNTISGTGAALKCGPTSSGSVTIGTGTTLQNANHGITVSGSGTIMLTGASMIIQNCQDGINISGSSSNVTIGNGVTIQNNTQDGIDITNSASSNVTIGAGVKIQNNGGYGVLVGDVGSVNISGADITGNTSYGVSRTSGTTLAGGVTLNNVRLFGNNGFGGGDMNTTVTNTDGNSDQFRYLINTRNSVTNPR